MMPKLSVNLICHAEQSDERNGDAIHLDLPSLGNYIEVFHFTVQIDPDESPETANKIEAPGIDAFQIRH